MQLSKPFSQAGKDDQHIGIELTGGRALFTTRRGGVSDGPYASLNLGRSDTRGGENDKSELVATNREILAKQIGIPSGRFAYVRQVHGSLVVQARKEDPSPDHERWREADGQVTVMPDTPVLVLVADCLPIALSAPGAVGMLHAGWQGLAAGVIEQGVLAMQALVGDQPIDAAIGPGAGACCYEVNKDMEQAFSVDGPEVFNNSRLDLKLVARRRLRQAGVVTVYDVGLCTICSDPSLFFSHRRDKGLTGRQAGLIWRS